jgi:hypothetical protein
MTTSDDWAETEVQALRLAFLADDTFNPPSDKMIGALGSLMTEGLGHSSRELRLAALREITGIERLGTSKMLTWITVHTLIEYLKKEHTWELSDDGRRFLVAIKERVLAEHDIRLGRRTRKGASDGDGDADQLSPEPAKGDVDWESWGFDLEGVAADLPDLRATN